MDITREREFGFIYRYMDYPYFITVNLAHKILKLLVHAILLMVSYAFLFIVSFLIVSSQFEGTFDGVPIGVICLIGRGRELLKIIRTYSLFLSYMISK